MAFTPERGTIDAIFKLRWILEKFEMAGRKLSCGICWFGKSIWSYPKKSDLAGTEKGVIDKRDISHYENV